MSSAHALNLAGAQAHSRRSSATGSHSPIVNDSLLMIVEVQAIRLVLRRV